MIAAENTITAVESPYTIEMLRDYSTFFKNYKVREADELIAQLEKLALMTGEDMSEQIEMAKRDNKYLHQNPLYIEILEKKTVELNEALHNLECEVGDAFNDFDVESEGIEGFLNRFEFIERKMIYSAKNKGIEGLLKAYVHLTNYKIRGKIWSQADSYRSIRAKRILNYIGEEWKDKKTLIQYFMYKKWAKETKKEPPKWINYFDKVNESDKSIITTNELRELMGTQRINYYAINKLIDVGLLRRVKRGVYEINKIEEKEWVFKAVNKFYEVIQEVLSVYIDPMRKIELGEFEGKDEFKESIERKAMDNILSVSIAKERVREIDEIARKTYEAINQG